MLRHDSPSSDGPGGVVSAFGVCTAVRFAVVDAGRACETSGTSGALSASSVRMALTRSRRAGMGIVAGGWRRGCRADAETSPSRLHRQFREFAAVPGVTGCGNGTAGHVPWVPCRRCDRLAAAVRGKCRGVGVCREGSGSRARWSCGLSRSDADPYFRDVRRADDANARSVGFRGHWKHT